VVVAIYRMCTQPQKIGHIPLAVVVIGIVMWKSKIVVID